jgi:hypothetical protein
MEDKKRNPDGMLSHQKQPVVLAKKMTKQRVVLSLRQKTDARKAL